MAMTSPSAAVSLSSVEHVAFQERPCLSDRTVALAASGGTSSKISQKAQSSFSVLQDRFSQVSLHSLRSPSTCHGIVDRSPSVVHCGAFNGATNGAVYGRVNGVANGSIHKVPRGVAFSEVKEVAKGEETLKPVVSELSIDPSAAIKLPTAITYPKEVPIDAQESKAHADVTTLTREPVRFTSIEEALDVVRQGKVVILVNDKDAGDVGNFFVAGALATEQSMAFMVNYGSGIVFSPASGPILDRLELPLMVEENIGGALPPLAFTVTVDLKEGTSTGISAADRALTIRRMAEADSQPEEFRKPGHVIPLRSSKGGVLQEPGHTEAAVDLAELAGLPPVGVLCGVTNSDGSMGQLPDLQLLARQHGLCLVSISDLVRYKREILVKRTAIARLPTKWGNFQIYSYTSLADGIEHVAMVKGDIGLGEDVLCRVHSECLTGDIFGSQRCDCGPQLEQAMERIEREGRGVMVYMRGHEGRGIGLGAKLQAYNLQDQGRDTVEANVDLGLPIDSREYDVSAQILRDLGVRSLRLMTNNPAKYHALMGYGLVVKKRVPVFCPITLENKRYLETKRQKMGHLYGSDLHAPFGGLPEELEKTSE